MGYLRNYSSWRKINEATIVVNKINGNMPDSSLVKISVEPGEAQGIHKLNPEAAADYEKMKRAAKEDGIVWGITDSYRPYAIQDKIFDWDRFTRTGEKKKKGTNIAAAYPGTSNHGFGSAVDLNLFGPGVIGEKRNSEKARNNYQATYSWLKANANRFGFYELKGEPWHWDHKPSAEKYRSSSGSALVPSQAISLSRLFKEKNPILSKKLNLFEKGNLIISSNTKSAEDIILLFKKYLPEQYRKELSESELSSPEYSEEFQKIIQKFQKDKGLPRVDGKIDIATYNEVFKDILAKPSSSGNREVIKLPSYVITRGNESFDFALIYGGNPSSQWGAEKMYKLVDGILAGKGKNVIYSNNENSIGQVQKTLTERFPNAKIVSVSGFSGGGTKAISALKTNNYKFVGLIDPYLTAPILDLPKNSEIMFRPENWGGKEAFNTVKQIMNQMKDSSSDKVKNGIVNISHSDMPTAFFSKYGDKI